MDVLKGYTAENGTTRTFCSHCGSSLTFSSPRAPEEEVEIALGAMDEEVPVEPGCDVRFWPLVAVENSISLGV